MRLRKKILTLLVIMLGLGSFGSFIDIPMTSPVYAQQATPVTGTPTDNTAAPSKEKEATMEDNFRNIADIFLKVGYILLWPLIMLSGLALDNTMVYGEIFHMDAPLRQFRNICKNFANFGLGFMILIAIIKSIFMLGGITKPMDTIKKAAIAGILIQVSWFLVAALVDISTIATYAIGGMPMSILKTQSNSINQKILQPNVIMNVNNEKPINSNNFIVSYQVKTKEGTNVFLSSCAHKSDAKNVSYIYGRDLGDEKFNNQGKLGLGAGKETVNACVYLNKVYFFQEFPDAASVTGQAYKDKLKDITALQNNRDIREKCGYVVRIDEGTGSKAVTCASSSYAGYMSEAEIKKAVDANYKRYTDPKEVTIGTGTATKWFDESLATNLSDLIDKSKGFVGPLASIYTSLLDFANLSDTSNGNGALDKGIGEVIIRTGVAAGLIFPLLALTVVLVIRIGFLRCIIAASPLILLVKVFKDELGGLVKGISEHIEIGNIIKAIFAPVITVFALSMGLIFMSALVATYKGDNLKTGLKEMNIEYQKGAEGEMDSIDIFGMLIKYPKSMNTYAGATGDWFSWMIVCFSGIGIMWFVLFAAIGASGTIGKVGEKIQSFGENMINTAPIANFGGAKVGLGTLAKNFSPTSDYARNNATTKWNNTVGDQQAAIDAALGKSDALNKETGTKVISMLKSEDYTGARTALVGTDPTKTTDESVGQAIYNNKDISARVRTLDEKKQKDLFTGLGSGVEASRQKSEARNNFTSTLGTPKTEADIDTALKNPTAINLAKLDKGYNTEVTIGETTYTIKASGDNLIKEVKTGSKTETSSK